ncbi:MAG: phosphoenolpyruvate--protein phosphotransferase [Nitrospinae bacterium]|nr:phosphoenolpyruvate--protein phosphotransferase [Nitrospinota bacterium]
MSEPEIEDNVFVGIPASTGIIIGKAYVLDRHMICVLEQSVPEDELDAEIERFYEAAESCRSEIREIADRSRSESGEDIPSLVFDTHFQILNDPSVLSDVKNIMVERRCNAEWAIKVLLEKYQTSFSKIKDQYFRDRLLDIEQALTRLQRHLIQGGDGGTLDDLTEPVIIVSHDLSPADTIQLTPGKVMGFAIDVGGKTAHAGIIASSMDIPAVVGLKTLSLNTRSGDALIIDGNAGEVVLRPTTAQFVKYNKRRQKHLYYDQAVHAKKHLEAVTTDGVKVKVLANIESSQDLAHLAEHGAEGVGLYRTEYLFIHRSKWPGEEEQFEDYRKVAEAVKSNWAIIRTLDMGGDKLPTGSDYMDMAAEPNPALGLRAIRFCLSEPAVFKTQLRAILRASAFGNLKIMYPLITAPEELIAANALLEEAKGELAGEGIAYNPAIETGIMIETPSSALFAGHLAKLCSFFSIGTNDLIQYTLAIDRMNEKVAYLYQPFSPAILKLLSQTIMEAEKAGISVSVCGKMADDPVSVAILLGMGGLRELSMDVHSIPRLKQFIRSISVKDARAIAERALEMTDAEEIKSFVMKHIGDKTREGLTAEFAPDGD